MSRLSHFAHLIPPRMTLGGGWRDRSWSLNIYTAPVGRIVFLPGIAADDLAAAQAAAADQLYEPEWTPAGKSWRAARPALAVCR